MAVARDGGLLDAYVLAAHTSLIDKPLIGHYRGHEIALQQPPTMGALLLQQLKLVEQLSDGTHPWGSPDWLHLLIGAQTASLSDLDACLLDPALPTVYPVFLLTAAYINLGDRKIPVERKH